MHHRFWRFVAYVGAGFVAGTPWAPLSLDPDQPTTERSSPGLHGARTLEQIQRETLMPLRGFLLRHSGSIELAHLATTIARPARPDRPDGRT